MALPRPPIIRSIRAFASVGSKFMGPLHSVEGLVQRMTDKEGHVNGAPKVVLKEDAEDFLKYIELMRPAEISMVVHYMAKARYDDRKFWKDICRVLCSEKAVASFRVRDLSMIISSLNGAELLDDETLARLSVKIHEASCTMDMESLSFLIMTYIKLSDTGVESAAEGCLKALGPKDFHPITSVCVDYLQRRLEAVTVHNVVEIFSGLATLQCDNVQFYEAMLRKCRLWTGTMPYESVAILLQAMAKSKTRDAELEGKIALRLSESISKAKTEAELQSSGVWMSSLMHHFSKLNGDPHPTVQKTIINQLPLVVDTMSTESLMLMVPPLPLLLTGTPPKVFRDRVFSEKCRKELPHFTKEGLCAIMSAAYRLSYTYDSSWWKEASDLTIKPILESRWSAVSVATVAYQLTHLAEAEHNIHASLDQLRTFHDIRSAWFDKVKDALGAQMTRWPPRPVSTLLACYIKMEACPPSMLERAVGRAKADIGRYDALSLTQVITAMAKFNSVDIPLLEEIERRFKSGRVKFSRSQLRAIKRAYDAIDRDKACITS